MSTIHLCCCRHDACSQCPEAVPLIGVLQETISSGAEVPVLMDIYISQMNPILHQ